MRPSTLAPLVLAAAAAWLACSGSDRSDGPPACVAAVETCNGVDDDCDGTADDGLQGCCTPGDTQACALQPGVCAPGTATCGADRAWGPCLGDDGQPVPDLGTVAEACNGVDDDCDGVVDEDLANVTCGVGACRRQVPSCVAGVPQTCTPGDPSFELCNGVDDDCDGMIDEDLPGSCATGLPGVCGTGLAYCVEGMSACVPLFQPGSQAERCGNGVDDDCDGVVDEPDCQAG